MASKRSEEDRKRSMRSEKIFSDILQDDRMDRVCPRCGIATCLKVCKKCGGETVKME